jgi:pilus assembly protein CpaE
VLLVSLGGSAADQLERTLARIGLSVSVSRELAVAMSQLAQADLIVAEAADGASLAMLCRRINDESGSSHPPILAVAPDRDVETRVKMLEAGADDVVAQPLDEREVRALVDALLLRSSGGTRGEASVAPPVPRPPAAPGRVIAFAAAKGGSGTTTLAVNTAVVLAEMAPGSVAIADLDMFHGQVATHLDIYGRGSTALLAREDLESQSPETIQESGRLHPSGLMVFGGVYRPDDAIDVNADQLARLLNTLRSMYGTVVIDAGSTLDPRAMTVIERADRVALVVTPDIPSLRLLHAALQVMSDAGSAAERTFFVVNDIYPKTSITGDQIEEHLGIKVGLAVPYDSENFLRAVNEGQPIVSLARRSAATAAIKRLAEQLSVASIDVPEVRPARRGLLGGLLGRG